MRRLLAFAFILAYLLCAASVSRGVPVALAATCNGLAPTIQGNDTAETLNGTPGDDVVDGAGGDDVINGLGGNDTICGGFGDDLMTGGPGNDYMDGQGYGPGFNGVDYIDAPNPVNVTIAVQMTITADGTDTVRNVLKLRGSQFDDTVTGFFVLFGEGGNDTLTGDDNINTIIGGGGNDTLNGLGGADVLQPGAGIDTVNGGTTAGNPNNGGNSDTLDYADASGPVTVTNGRTTGTTTGDGADALSSIENVNGGPFGDTFINDDVLCILNYQGFGGNDTFTMLHNESCRPSIAPGAGDDTVAGDPDTALCGGCALELVYTAAPGPVNLNLTTGIATGEGTDTISRIVSVRGSKFNDVIVGDDYRNRLFGDEGDDEIHGDGNGDVLIGGPGNDILDGGSTLGIEDFEFGEGPVPGTDFDIVDYQEEGFGSVRYAAAGPVNVNLITGLATGDGSDTLSNVEAAEGSNFGDTIVLRDTGDTVNQPSGYGSGGNDTITGSAGPDFLNGGPGTDNIFGLGGNDHIAAEGCFGTCGGGIAGGTIDGGADDDFLETSQSNDTVIGGTGIDEVAFPRGAFGGPVTGVTVNLITQTTTGFGPDTLSGIEDASGSPVDDTIIGNDGPNHLRGGQVSMEASGVDNISGNGGNDRIEGYDGNDTLDGGADFDTLDYSAPINTQGGAVVDLCAHTATGIWGVDAVTAFERVNGTFGGDTITGCAGNEYLFGASGDDTLNSGGGIDTLDGDFGTDACNGNADDTYIACESNASACPGDVDCDGAADVSDNCLGTTNSNQKNTDAEPFVTPAAPNDTSVPFADARGDACDFDDDNDGLQDANEAVGCNTHMPTDPLKRDSDGDRVMDFAECLLGSDPMNVASKPALPAPATDADGDGLSDDVEVNFLGTDPHSVDTDGDKILDGIEFKGYGTSSSFADTDGDGCSDGMEIGSVDTVSAVNSLDLVLLAIRFLRTDVPVHDTNKDGVVNSLDLQLIARNFNPANC